MLHGGGMSLEVFVPDSGLLCVRVASPVGCCAALQASAPLITGCWHLLMLDMGAPNSDGMLSIRSFASLIGKDGTYLIEHHSLRLAPSVGTLLELELGSG